MEPMTATELVKVLARTRRQGFRRGFGMGVIAFLMIEAVHVEFQKATGKSTVKMLEKKIRDMTKETDEGKKDS